MREPIVWLAWCCLLGFSGCDTDDTSVRAEDASAAGDVQDSRGDGNEAVSDAPVRDAHPDNGAILIDHTCTDLSSIPAEWVEQARLNLHIAYGHTSHGSQLTSGMTGLVGQTGLSGYQGDIYGWSQGGSDGTLHLHEGFPGSAEDLGNPDRTSWEESTRTYLAEHPATNVVIWSWCGQVSSATEEDIETYLTLMAGLERDFPEVRFVYMTGHLDGTGLEGNLHLRNEQIREYCRDNGKVLYDFADIESYDPDGTYFGDRYATDACDYDSDGDGEANDGANWAEEWQSSHTEGVEWYSCSCAHSVALNCNQKAYAAWWLWARLAGWDGL